MPAPLLLVDDDLATIAQVKRLLAREGYEVVLATNAADAVIAWGHHLPPLVILNPKVESDRGQIVLEELRSHPDAQLLHVLLLGESVAGFGYPIASLPIDTETFTQTVHELVRGTTTSEGWRVEVSPRTRTEELEAVGAPAAPVESDDWRATRKSPAPGRADDEHAEREEPPTEVFELPQSPTSLFDTQTPGSEPQPDEVTFQPAQEQAPDEGELPAPQVSPPTQELENSLFGDLEANIGSEMEAQAMASVAASLAQMPVDDELQALEDDVRAEAARRRMLRQKPEAPSVGLPTPDRAPPPSPAAPGEDSFAGVGDAPRKAAAEDSMSGFDDPSAKATAEDSMSGFDDPSAKPSTAEDSMSGFDDPSAKAPSAEGVEGPPGAATSAPRESDDAVAARLQEESAKARETLGRAERAARAAAEALEQRGQQSAEKVQALEAELEAARHAVEQAEARARELHDGLEAARHRVAELEDHAQQGNSAVSELEASAQAEREEHERLQSALQAERERLQNELSELQAQSELEREEHERLRSELREGRDKVEGEGKQLWSEVERLEGELTALRADLEAARKEANEDKAQLTQRSEAAAMLELELDETKQKLDQSESAVRAHAEALDQSRAAVDQLREEIETARSSATEFQARLERIHEARLALERERDVLKDELDVNRIQSHELASAAQRAAGALRDAMEEAEQAEARADAAETERQTAQALAAENEKARAEALSVAEVLRARAERADAEAQVASQRATNAEQRAQEAETRGTAAEEGLRALQGEVEALKAEFAKTHQAQRDLEEALEDARAANLEVRARADQSDSKVRLLEEKSQLPLKVPNRAPLSITRFGNVELGELARLVGQLVLARAEVRLELAAPGGRRTLWLARGAVVAAESTFGSESLLDRARRDGLIDARQTSELQMIRSATPAETVVVLKERGFVRDAEVVPLVQRYTEQVALDAFSEVTSEYRLTEDNPGPETLAATLPRPTLPLVAEALRRALPVEELLLRLGGSEAVPVTLESELDLRAMGFADKERRMLGYCDGEANVEDLALASGLKADVAFRALLVAKLLGLIELKVPARTTVATNPEVDVQRLEAKFEQVQEADYFTMLGLGRAAGGDEVLRAWQRLAEEFDPLKYSGHPDAALQQRAQLVYSVLEEAARALGDDRRRAEYARHLVD